MLPVVSVACAEHKKYLSDYSSTVVIIRLCQIQESSIFLNSVFNPKFTTKISAPIFIFRGLLPPSELCIKLA